MVHVCSECNKFFREADHLLNHCKAKGHRLVSTTVPGSSAPPSARPLPSPSDVSQALQCKVNRPTGFNCWSCQTWAADGVGLIEHWKEKHAPKDSKIAVLRPDRGVRTTTEQGKSTINSKQSKKTAPNPWKSHPRGWDSEFRHPDDLAKPTEHPSAENRCRVCNISVENKAQHYNESHPHLKCDDCGRMFVSSDEFECHVRDAHNHNSCTFCNVTFKPQETLECCQHIVRCHAGELSLAECVICRKEYRNMDVLSEHIKAVHRSRNSGVLHTANGVAKYCSVNGPFSSTFVAKSTKRMEGCFSTDRSSILPGEEVKSGERGGSPTPNNTGAPGSSTPIGAVNTSVATPTAESEATADGSQDKSDATRTEDAARPEGSLATPGGWERSSSLAASDGNSGPEMNGVSEAGVLADFIRADGSGTDDNISVLELASGGQGNAADADPESDGDGRGRLSASSVVGTDELAECANSVPSVLHMSDSETSKPEDEAPNTAPADRQEVSTAPPRL